MKKLSQWVLPFLAPALLLVGCAAGSTAEQTPATYRQVSSAEAAEIMQEESDYFLLDARTQEEYETGHIPGAVCIPNETIGDTEPEQLTDKEQLILVYCRTGRRSKEASQKLAEMGYSNVVEFGGIVDWTGETVSGANP